MYTVRETVLFQNLVAAILTDGERTEFIDWIAENPLAGDVIPGAGGLRKFDGGVKVLAKAVAPG